MDLKHGASLCLVACFSFLDVEKLSIGDKQYALRVGDKEAVSQLFYCYKDEKKGVIPGSNG